MKITVGPARRPGISIEIYDEPVAVPDLERHSDGSVTLTIETLGIRCHKSRYRYQLRLSRSEMVKLAEVVSSE
jgi:hypothetical protein